MSQQSPALPLLSPLRARLLNALTTRVLPLNFELEADASPLTCRLSLNSAAAATAQSAPFAALFVLYFRSGESLWKVEFASAEALTLRPELERWRRNQPLSALPEELCLAVLEHLFAPALDAAARHCGCEARFVNAPDKAPAWSEALPLVLTLPDGREVDLRLSWSDDKALRFLLGVLEASPLRMPQGIASLLPDAVLSCPLEIGTMHLLADEAASLRCGDVLLPESWTPESPRLKIPSSATLLCRLENSTLTVLARDAGSAPDASPSADANEVVMPETKNTDPLLDQQALLSTELPVTFELASLHLKVQDAAALTPGFTFALAGEASSVPVFVRVGGRIMAKGRLVDVGGMPGVQITGLSDAPEKAGDK